MHHNQMRVNMCNIRAEEGWSQASLTLVLSNSPLVLSNSPKRPILVRLEGLTKSPSRCLSYLYLKAKGAKVQFNNIPDIGIK